MDHSPYSYHSLPFQEFKKLRNTFIKFLAFPEKLFNVAVHIQNLLPRPVFTKLFIDKLQIDYGLIEAFDKAPSTIKDTMALFTPIANTIGSFSSGFSAISQAITGTHWG